MNDSGLAPLDLLLQAQLAIAKQHPEQAFAALARIPDNQPIAAQAHLLAGRLWRERHCMRKAEAEFRLAPGLKPTLLEAHKELIYILGIQARRQEIDAEFHALARLTPLSHHDLFTWALTHFTHWSPDIVEDLDGFIKADPEDRYSRLAVVELLLERPGEKVSSYIDQVLKPLAEADPDALALRIEFAFNRGRVAEAERLLTRCGESAPHRPDPRRNRASPPRRRCCNPVLQASAYRRSVRPRLAHASCPGAPAQGRSGDRGGLP